MIIALFAILSLWLFVFVFFAKFIRDRLKGSKKVTIENLHAYRLRLHSVVSEMMGKANELDQHRQYVAHESTAQISDRLAGICQDLVVLSESLPMIEHLLKEGNIKHARRDLLITVNSTVRLNQHLDGVSNQLRLLTEAQLPKSENVMPGLQRKSTSES